MGKLLSRVKSRLPGTGGSDGGGNSTGLSGYHGTIVDKSMDVIAGQKARKQRKDPSFLELLGQS